MKVNPSVQCNLLLSGLVVRLESSSCQVLILDPVKLIVVVIIILLSTIIPHIHLQPQTQILDSYVTHECKEIIVTGDFNFDVSDADNSGTSEPLISCFNLFQMTQLVHDPTRVTELTKNYY